MGLFSYLLTFIEGILSFISPCILPMLPLYFLYLAGVSQSTNISNNHKNNKLLINSIAFVIGFTIIFILLGATATSFGNFFKHNKSLLRKISGIIIIIFGLNFTGIIKIKPLNMEKRFHYSSEDMSFLGSLIFGSVFGFGWTPCIGPFLGSSLALAGNSSTIYEGILLLFTYSLGLGIPFIISSIIFDKIKDIFRQIQKYSRLISIISGILLIIEGVLIFTDSLKYFNNIL